LTAIEGMHSEKASLALCTKVFVAISDGNETVNAIVAASLRPENSVRRALNQLEQIGVIVGQPLRWGGPAFYRRGPHWADFELLVSTAIKLELLPSRD